MKFVSLTHIFIIFLILLTQTNCHSKSEKERDKDLDYIERSLVLFKGLSFSQKIESLEAVMQLTSPEVNSNSREAKYKQMAYIDLLERLTDQKKTR